MIRREQSAGKDLETVVEVDSGRARYEVHTVDPLYQERLEHMGWLEHMGYRRDATDRFVRDLSATGDVLAIFANHARHLEEMIRQSARLSPVLWEQALEGVLARVEGSDLDWFLYGSAALAVRGIDVDPGDLDLHVSDAYLTGLLFAAETSTTASARSWTGRHAMASSTATCHPLRSQAPCSRRPSRSLDPQEMAVT